jgi:fluoride exporter
MAEWLLIGLGGSLGAVLRHLLSTLQSRLAPSAFPYATLLINISGSLMLGLFMGLVHPGDFHEAWNHAVHPFTTGFLGGYTTFSTFSVECIRLWNEKSRATAALYVTLSVSLGLIAVWSGFELAAQLPAPR